MNRLVTLVTLVSLLAACGSEQKRSCKKARGKMLTNLEARLAQKQDHGESNARTVEIFELLRVGTEEHFVDVCMELDPSTVGCIAGIDELLAANLVQGEALSKCDPIEREELYERHLELENGDPIPPTPCEAVAIAEWEAALGDCLETMNELDKSLMARLDAEQAK